METLRILHLEDNPSDAGLINHALQKGQLKFEVFVVDTRAEYISAIAHYKPHVVLSDHSLPSFNSYEALTIFKQCNLNIPFILITSTISEDFAVDIMKRGADDYVLKDRLDRLPSALQSALDKFKLANDHKNNLKMLDAVAEERNIILESIQDGFYALDRDWIVTYWNTEAENILNRSKAEVIGKNIWEEYPESLHSISYLNFHLAVKDRKVQQFEVYNHDTNNWLEVVAYPSAIGLSVYFKNINERKRAEQERMNMVNDILQRNSELEQFSYIISHNLRSPVANISGLAREIGQGNLSSDDITLLSKHLMDSAGQLDHVIIDLNQILNVKRKISEIMENVILSSLIEDILKIILTPRQAEELTVYRDFGAWDEIWTTKSYFYSIFYNLISNSIKYCRAEVPTIIRIKTEKTGSKLIVRFEDNGLGIDLAKHGQEIFGLYKRFHQHIGGKGMGLFMVKTQMESLGGKICVTSELNMGTAFEMEFNINKPE